MYIPNSEIAFAPDRYKPILGLFEQAEYHYNKMLILNPSAQLPYHNIIHTRFVIEDSFLCAGEFADYDLVLAAMYHDFGYIIGNQDKDNVERASIYCLRSTANKTAASMILCTEFDGKSFPIEPTTPQEKALRDADLSSIFHIFEDDGRLLMRGLYEEMRRVDHLAGRVPINPYGFVKRTQEFFAKRTWYTELGQYMYDTHFEECYDELTRIAGEWW